MPYGASYLDRSPQRNRHARLRVALAMTIVVSAGITSQNVLAQQQAQQTAEEEEEKVGWSNATDLSFVLTAGNSSSKTLGLSNQLRRVWTGARFEFDVSMVRSYTSDDRFFLIEPGLDFPVGGAPPNPPVSLVKPKPTLDVATSQIGGVYERNISRRLFWNVGGNWYRNNDAGILNRYTTYAGFGTNWVDRRRRHFSTSYAISYTEREEEKPDPEKDRRFSGGRVKWDYTERIKEGTTFDSDLAVNANFSDPSDLTIDTLNALTVSVISHVSLRVSLQWLFANEPALESDLDIIAYVDVINPDGVPGSGDERFRSVSSGATKVVLGSADARKDKLDTIFRTALVIKF